MQSDAGNLERKAGFTVSKFERLLPFELLGDQGDPNADDAAPAPPFDMRPTARQIPN
jgi:hypothetical protein